MSETDSAMGAESKRTLAAIVFTDVANFSALMEKDEDKTLRLVARDLDLIRKTCEKLGGKALKSTGDGLLMSFDSAVQAAACALQSQQKLGEQARKLPPEDVLKHRIGIHLGDVFITENDVMGDGVNVAARIQTEAPPGGICISQTVYDVVKNRLGVKATPLGPRDLKNIKEAVPIYQIILDAHGAAAPAGAAFTVLGRRWPFWAGAGGGVAALAVGLLVVLWLTIWGEGEPIRSALSGGKAGVGISTTSGPATAVVPREIVDAARREAVRTRNFTRMLQWLEGKGLKNTPLYARYSQMKILQVWLPAHLRNVSRDEPLVVDVPAVGPRPAQTLRVWHSDGAGDLVIEGPGGRREADVKDLDPPMAAGLARAVLKSLPVVNPGVGMAVRLYIDECKNLGLLAEDFR